jgi:hypothetical protein
MHDCHVFDDIETASPPRALFGPCTLLNDLAGPRAHVLSLRSTRPETMHLYIHQFLQDFVEAVHAVRAGHQAAATGDGAGGGGRGRGGGGGGGGGGGDGVREADQVGAVDLQGTHPLLMGLGDLGTGAGQDAVGALEPFSPTTPLYTPATLFTAAPWAARGESDRAARAGSPLPGVLCKDLHVYVGHPENALSQYVADVLGRGVVPPVPVAPTRTWRTLVLPGDALLEWACRVRDPTTMCVKPLVKPAQGAEE